MNILNLSLDRAITNVSSSVYARARAYAHHVDTYTGIVPHHQCVLTDGNLSICGIGGHKIWQSIAIAWYVWRWCLRPGAKLITIQDTAFLACVGVLVARCMGVVCELQIHGFEHQTILRRSIARWVITHADGIRVVSERLKQKLIAEFGIDAKFISVIPIALSNGADFPPRDYDVSREKILTFVCVARLVPVKRIAMQIDVVAQLHAQGISCQLWIIGDGPERQMLAKKITDNNLQDSVFLLGHIDDVNSYYDRADVFVLTSDAEGWGMAVIEAASRGLPIIMTDVGCAGEVIGNDQEGIIIPVGDTQALYRAMYALATDAKLRRRYGVAAQDKVRPLLRQKEAIALIVARWEHLVKNT